MGDQPGAHRTHEHDRTQSRAVSARVGAPQLGEQRLIGEQLWLTNTLAELEPRDPCIFPSYLQAYGTGALTSQHDRIAVYGSTLRPTRGLEESLSSAISKTARLCRPQLLISGLTVTCERSVLLHPELQEPSTLALRRGYLVIPETVPTPARTCLQVSTHMPGPLPIVR